MAGKTAKTLIAAHGLTLAYDAHPVLGNVSLRLHGGEALIITGVNGVGKTTLLRCLAGLIAPDEGDISRPENILYIGHRNGLAAELTAGENLRLWAGARGLNLGANTVKKACAQLGIASVVDTPIRNLSQGLQRRVALARAALMPATRHAPLWLFDEPLAAVDAAAAKACYGLIGKHRAAGGGIVMTAHGKSPLPQARVLNLKKPEPKR